MQDTYAIIKAFKERRIKAKEAFTLRQITKSEAYEFVKKYHYLEGNKFLSVYSIGMFIDTTLVCVATLSNPSGTNAMKSWFGLDNQDSSVLELTRLCLLPDLNGSNAASYLLGNSLKMLPDVRAVITLADSSRHVGSVYQVCNFKYYGLSDQKTDFYRADGKLNPRGETKNSQGVWIPRTRKHRYAYIIDKTLCPLLEEQPRPKLDDRLEQNCCNGEMIVYDKRFNKRYTCPVCIGKLVELK
jgi:hypothetical protein